MWQLWLSSVASASRFKHQRLLGSLLLSLGLTYGALLMSAELMYARGWHRHSIDAILTAQRIYPYLSYVKAGPMLVLNDDNFMRVLREDPQSLEKLAAALLKL